MMQRKFIGFLILAMLLAGFSGCSKTNEASITRLSPLGNPYKPVDKENIHLINGKLVNRIIPYGDLFSFFTRLPLGHAKATGNGIRIGIVGPRDYADFIYYIARDSRVYVLTELSVSQLLQNRIDIAVITDINEHDSNSLKDFTDECIKSNIPVIIEADCSEDSSSIKRANELESMGAIAVGQVDTRGVTYFYSPDMKDWHTEAFNDRLKDININVFAPNSFDGIRTGYVYSLYGVTGAAAMVLETRKLNPMELKNYLADHSVDAWEMCSIDGRIEYYNSYTVDNLTGRYNPKNDSELYALKLLDFQSLFNIETQIPWNAEIYNLSKAWEISTGKVDAAVICQGFLSDSPGIKKNTAEVKEFGKWDMSSTVIGTSMARAMLSIAPGAKLHLLSSDVPFDGENYDSTNLIDAIDYCIKNKIGIIAICITGSFRRDSKLIDKISEARDSGILIVWSDYPGSETGIIQPTSVYGDTPNRFAAFDRFVEEDGFYPQELITGASYETPQIAGLAALIKEAEPEMMPGEIEKLLKDNSTVLNGGQLIPDMYKILSRFSDN